MYTPVYIRPVYVRTTKFRIAFDFEVEIELILFKSKNEYAKKVMKCLTKLFFGSRLYV